MSISINAVLRKDKINRNNHAPINIRLTRKSKNRYVSTGVTLPLDAWNAESQQISPDYPNATELQFKVDAVRNEYDKKIKRLQALDIEVDFDSLFGTKSKQINCTVAEFFRQQVDRLESVAKIGTASKYGNCLALLSRSNPVDIRFEQIDVPYLQNFETFMRRRGNKDNYIATSLSVLKAVYNKAIADGVFKPKDNPFIKFKVGSLWKKTRKRAIAKEDIIRLKNLELPKDSHFGYKELSRDIFMFSYYTAGINFKDIATLRHSDIVNGRVSYSRHKTGKLISCQLLPDAQRIIDKYTSPFYDDDDYIFPILNRQIHITEQQIFNRIHKVLARVNANLKEYSKMLGLKFPLTTYVARHTYATVLKRSGVNIAIISESLGHSDLATTQIYLDSFENSQIDEAMQNLL